MKSVAGGGGRREGGLGRGRGHYWDRGLTVCADWSCVMFIK